MKRMKKYNPGKYKPFSLEAWVDRHEKYYFDVYINIIHIDNIVEVKSLFISIDSDSDEESNIIDTMTKDWINKQLEKEGLNHTVAYINNKFKTYLPYHYSQLELMEDKYYWITYLDEGWQMLEDGMPIDWIVKATGYTEDADARILFEMSGEIDV